MTMPEDNELYEPQYPVVPEETPEQQDNYTKHNDELQGLFKGVKPDDISDLTTVTDNDVMGDDGQGLDDLFDVSMSDIMGEKPKPKLKPRYRITSRGRNNIPPSIGGMRL